MSDEEVKAKILGAPELHAARHWLAVPSFRELGLQTIAGWLNDQGLTVGATVADAQRIVG